MTHESKLVSIRNKDKKWYSLAASLAFTCVCCLKAFVTYAISDLRLQLVLGLFCVATFFMAITCIVFSRRINKQEIIVDRELKVITFKYFYVADNSMRKTIHPELICPFEDILGVRCLTNQESGREFAVFSTKYGDITLTSNMTNFMEIKENFSDLNVLETRKSIFDNPHTNIWISCITAGIIFILIMIYLLF